MKSKGKVLDDLAMELNNSSFADLDISRPAESVQKVAEQAMDEHARNCMIEIMKWYRCANDKEDIAAAIKLVDGFLSSEYFKEIQEP